MYSIQNRSWIHIIYSKNEYNRLINFIQRNEKVSLFGYIVINGLIHFNTNCSPTTHTFGAKGKKSLLLHINSELDNYIDILIENNVIDDYYYVILLDNVIPSELNFRSNNPKIKNGKYLSKNQFQFHLLKLETDNTYNNEAFQYEESSKSTCILFMYYLGGIILGTVKFYKEEEDPNYLRLTNLCNTLFDILGVYSFSIYNHNEIIPIVEECIEINKKLSQKNDHYFLKYINWILQDFYQTLREFRILNDISTYNSHELLSSLNEKHFLWEFGALINRVMQISQNKKVPILLQFFNGLTGVFDSYGNWLYGDGKLLKIKKRITTFKNTLNFDQKKEYHEIIEYARELAEEIYKEIEKHDS